MRDCENDAPKSTYIYDSEDEEIGFKKCFSGDGDDSESGSPTEGGDNNESNREGHETYERPDYTEIGRAHV